MKLPTAATMPCLPYEFAPGLTNAVRKGKLPMPKPDLTCKAGDTLYIKCQNVKGEYSIYRVKITKETVEGDGLDEFLYETTGFEIE